MAAPRRRTAVLALLAALALLVPAAAALAQAPPPPASPLFYDGLRVPRVPFASRRVDVGGGRRMRVLEAGRRDGPPVLLLHGVPTWSYLWRDVIPHLDDRGHRIVAVDLIGFGRSDRPSGLRYDLVDHRRHLERLVRALGLRRPTLVGHDVGGAVALDFAAHHPRTVRAIVLMETFLPPVTEGRLPSLQQGIAAILRDPAATRSLLIDRNLFVEQAFQGPPTVLRPLARRDHDAYRAVLPHPADRRVLPPVPRQLLLQPTAAVRRVVGRALGWLGRTRAPVLYAYGTPGLLHTPETLTWLRSRVARLTTLDVGASGHFLQEDQPGRLGRRLGRWLARAVPARRSR
jgi:haloalkane dehalogenase